MTTTVTVTTHGWPVKVTTHDKLPDGTTADNSTTVEPNSTYSQAIFDSRSITLEELPMPAAAEPTASEPVATEPTAPEAAAADAA